MDLRAGARYETFSVNVFINNLADRRGVAGGGVSYAQSPYDVIFIQPRTAGLTLVKEF